MEIRRLRQGDDDRLRETRLRALAEDPAAFASTLEEERDFDPEVWVSRATNPTSVNFLAEDGGTVGIVAGITEDRPGVAQLVSMWVAPEARGKGVARLLIDAVVMWARDRGMRHLELWVTEDNDRARVLYERAGFSATGERQPVPSDPSRMEDRLVREI
jgi:GNAT superfamily N-acetyltransferase